jgi:SPP1 family predicted phage head-tail adaptor
MPSAPEWPEIDPGRFRQRITLLERRQDQDASGAKTTYAPATPPVRAWAEIVFVRGTEVLKAGQDVSQVFLTLTTWYRKELVKGGRFLAPDGSEFIIQALENVRMLNVYHVLTCIGVGGNQ